MTDPTLSARVRYERKEYVALVLEYLPYALSVRKGGRPGPEGEQASAPLRGITRLAATLVASLAFIYKSLRVGECHFTFNPAGFERRAKTGTSQVPWSSLSKVYRLPAGYLFAKSGGGYPLPYRCLSAEGRNRLENMLNLAGHGENAA